MPQACTICNHPKRLDIDRALVSGRSIASIGRDFKASESALANHRDKHLAHQLVTAQATKDMLHSTDLRDRLDDLLRRSHEILVECQADKRYNTALYAIRECRSTLELMSKLAFTLLELENQEHIKEMEQYDLELLNQRELEMLTRLLRKAGGDKRCTADVVREFSAEERLIAEYMKSTPIEHQNKKQSKRFKRSRPVMTANSDTHKLKPGEPSSSDSLDYRSKPARRKRTTFWGDNTAHSRQMLGRYIDAGGGMPVE